VTLKGMTVECGRALGIYLEGGEGNSIEKCTIRNFGTVASCSAREPSDIPPYHADDYTGVPVSREVGTFHAHYYRNTAWDRNPGRRHTISGCEVYGPGRVGSYWRREQEGSGTRGQ